MKNLKDTTVFVGLSGGVDSSVCALRLRNDGYKVVGVFIKVWHPDFLECNWEQERLDAMRVAARLEIPFQTCDAQKEYKDDVADYFVTEYRDGRTPNPDVMCNKYVKFGAFLKYALDNGADYIATGHYAQTVAENGVHRLLRGVDTNKDQSYFLWTLTQEQLSKVLLPIGNSTKQEIRTEAAQNGLLTATKKDSQGICFLGHVDIAQFLSHYVSLQEGDVIDINGRTIGTHKGALVYTNGQRHGFSITQEVDNSSPLYVISRDLHSNTITVANKQSVKEQKSTIVLSDLNYIAWAPKIGNSILIQTRYRQHPHSCTLVAQTDTTLTLQYTEKSEDISSGQSCVLYEGITCCGGGIIL